MKNVLSIQSHVVFGHAGNSVAEFSMRRMGVNVWPLNTVQFSNHTQYGQWGGLTMPSGHLKEIVQGIENINQLASCDAVLSGYLGSAEQGQEILDLVAQTKKNNPKAIYFCDPVMAHPDKGCFVGPGISEFIKKHVVCNADVTAPNLFELEMVTDERINNLDDAVKACRKLISMGPKIVLVKHLGRGGKDKKSFEMLLVSEKETWHISRPLVEFDKEPVGVGDLTSGLLLVNLLKGKNLKEALESVASSVYEVMLQTKEMNSYELQLIAAQDRMVNPTHHFEAKAL